MNTRDLSVEGLLISRPTGIVFCKYNMPFTNMVPTLIIPAFAKEQNYLFPSEAIHQRILWYSKLVIAQAITKLLYNKVLKPNNKSAFT